MLILYERLTEEKMMNKIKHIDTEYNGYLFRSRLEARWAVFFDACGIEYEYEPEGFDLGDGLHYLPDFLLHGVAGRDGGDLYVEVKGKMSELDAIKITRFYELGEKQGEKSQTAILVLGPIPNGECIGELDEVISDMAYSANQGPNYFNFETIDGDYFAAHPGINKDGEFELFGDDSSYLEARDDDRTFQAFKKARQARFEFGETPRKKDNNKIR